MTNGLLDPRHVKARFCGAKRKTKVQKETTSPLWYETLEFHEMLPADLNYAPDILLQVRNDVSYTDLVSS